MDNNNTLKSGTCPKCGGTDVYTTRDIAKRGERMQLAIASMKWFYLDTYVCTSCFHFEEHVSEKEKTDVNTVAKIKETWNKV